MEKIFLCNISDEDAAKLGRTASNMRIKVIQVEPRLYGNTLGDIVEGVADTKELSGDIKDSVMIFSGVTDKHMDKMLMAARTLQNKITYKAIVTPVNRHWNMAKLIFELEKESKMY